MKIMIAIFSIVLAQSAFAASETKDFDSKGLTSVSVLDHSGKVTISKIDGSKAIVTTTKNKFSDKCKMTEEKSGNQLVLKVEKGPGFMDSDECDVDFEIKVPKTVDLELMLGSGNIKITGIEGALSYKMGSGDLTAEGAFKKVDGKAGSGNVSMKGLNGPGEFRSGSGDLKLSYSSVPTTGEVNIRAGSGDATVSFPKGSKIKTDFKAGSGKLTNELGDNPSASFAVSMKAGSGNLNVKAN